MSAPIVPTGATTATNWILAFSQDAFALSGIPGSALLGEAFKAVMEKRMRHARDVLTEELKRGAISIPEASAADPLAAMLFRYIRAAQEGSARLNLRLLAQVIAGQAHCGNLIADEFLYYADILSGLKREEIIFVAELHRALANTRQNNAEVQVQNLEALKLLTQKLVPEPFASPMD
ncbi:MAG: hypothetical protein FJX46_04475 [Alphaproteobacteria bacterium]|nr:hypothetical protein [Alphaproteobacteria bacterium]